MRSSKDAFTMIEVVFVIVILGILAAIAVPKMAATRIDAQIAKGKADVASIRSSIISERQARLIKGDSKWITKLHSSSTSYFDNNGTSSSSILMYAVVPEDKDGHWHGAAAAGANKWAYKYKVGGVDVTFTYDNQNGTFTCSTTTGTQKQKDMCKKLIH